MTFDELPVGALLSHVIPMCAINMRHGEVEVYESPLASSAKIDIALKPEQLWALEADGKLECSSDSGDCDPDLSYRYIHYIKR